jgi:hypothetical protein
MPACELMLRLAHDVDNETAAWSVTFGAGRSDPHY